MGPIGRTLSSASPEGLTHHGSDGHSTRVLTAAVEGEHGSSAGAHVRDPQRTILGVLTVATAIGGMGLAAGGTAGALLGAELAGIQAAGLPPGLLVVGSAAAAWLMSWHTARAGRIRSLTLGYVVGVLGAVLAIAAAMASSLVALLVGSTMLGAANASIFLTRYAAAEIGGEAARGRALGTVFLATAVGAVASPNLLGPSGYLAHAVGLPRLTGLYLVAVVAFAAAAMILVALSKSNLVNGARNATLLAAHQRDRFPRRGIVAVLKVPPARAALVVLATSNLVMVAVMAVAPVHLMAHGQSLSVIGAAVSIHVAGMFGPSPLSGWLVDRIGPVLVGTLGLALLGLAGIAGALIPDHGSVSLIVVLAVLGVGWNCGVVGGSAQLAASVPPAQRPHVEGIGEVAMGVAAAVGAPLAGIVVAMGSPTALWLSFGPLCGDGLGALFGAGAG